MTSVMKGDFTYKVSSVLNRDVKQFGKKYLFDGKEETCWNSDQGSPQSVQIVYPQEVVIGSFIIQFQGGFVGQNCWLTSIQEDGTVNKPEPFYPEDVNAVQTFVLPHPIKAKQVDFVFEKSSDFFGRIIIYQMDVLSPKSNVLHC